MKVEAWLETDWHVKSKNISLWDDSEYSEDMQTQTHASYPLPAREVPSLHFKEAVYPT